jgi:hypothetical protein
MDIISIKLNLNFSTPLFTAVFQYWIPASFFNTDYQQHFQGRFLTSFFNVIIQHWFLMPFFKAIFNAIF